MTMIEVPPALARETIRRHGDAGRDWLDRLPELVTALLDRWDGVLDGPATHGGVALVLPVRRIRGPVALKVSFPGRVTWSNGGRWSRSTEPGRSGSRQPMTSPARCCSSVQGRTRWPRSPTRRWRPHSPVGWVDGLRCPPRAIYPDWPTRWRDGGTSWSTSTPGSETGVRCLPALDHALASIDALACDDVSTLTHGDLHFDNVLRGDREPWLAVDPMAYVGSAAYEAGTIVRERMGELLDRRDPARAARRRLAIFSEAAEVDLDLSLRCAQARLASSYYWERQHDRDLTAVRHLHDLALALTP